MEYFRKTGAMGGKARANKHTPEGLSDWRELGGSARLPDRQQSERQPASEPWLMSFSRACKGISRMIARRAPYSPRAVSLG